MDIITQRFIAIGNKLLAELRRIGDALRILHTDSQQQIETISKANDAAEKRRQAPPMPRPELEIPQPEKHQQQRANAEKKWLERGKILLEVLTLAAIVVYAIYACRQWITMNNTYKEIQQQTSPWGQKPFVDLSSATVFKPPTDKGGIAMVVLSFTNRGRTPAKNVRVVTHMAIRQAGSQPCPPSVSAFPANGPTYPSDTPQKLLERIQITPAQLEAYKSGTARLYVWGRFMYLDFWLFRNPDSNPRTSIFCRSFGIEDEQIMRMTPAPDGASIMSPCTASEWPFDDLTGDQWDKYEACNQKEKGKQ